MESKSNVIKRWCVFTDVILFWPGCELSQSDFAALCMHRLEPEIGESMKATEISSYLNFYFK